MTEYDEFELLKRSGAKLPIDNWVCRHQRKEVVSMVEQYLLITLKLLFAGLVSVTIINIALIIVLVHMIGKQN